jgi:hypothetical protein
MNSMPQDGVARFLSTLDTLRSDVEELIARDIDLEAQLAEARA